MSTIRDEMAKVIDEAQNTPKIIDHDAPRWHFSLSSAQAILDMPQVKALVDAAGGMEHEVLSMASRNGIIISGDLANKLSRLRSSLAPFKVGA